MRENPHVRMRHCANDSLRLCEIAHDCTCCPANHPSPAIRLQAPQTSMCGARGCDGHGLIDCRRQKHDPPPPPHEHRAHVRTRTPRCLRANPDRSQHGASPAGVRPPPLSAPQDHGGSQPQTTSTAPVIACANRNGSALQHCRFLYSDTIENPYDFTG